MSRTPDKRSLTQQGRSKGPVAGYQGRKGRADGKTASPARLAALEVVRILREREAFAQDVIAAHIDNTRMSPEDRAFATRLVLGVVSSRGTLDDILNRCMRSPEDVQDNVRDALQISTYEIIFLDKSAHAAVDQGVELVRSVAPRAAGLANAVLRKVLQAKKAFPFGDPRTDIAAYARLHAFPEWLARKLIQDLGPEKAHAFMAASNEPAPLFVALNAARGADEEVVEVLSAAHGEPQPEDVLGAPVEGCYRLVNGQVLVDGRVARQIAQGHLLVSDAASQAVAQRILPDEKPASFLEIGAGRGTKTIMIQSNAVRKWGSQIEGYVTLDNHEFKTKLLKDRAEEYGIHLEDAVTGDATKLDEVFGDRQFEAVFIDAPCTGLGTLRRHPEIRWRLHEETIDQYARLGLELLKSAAAHVAPGGTLAYATCTVTKQEDVAVVKEFLSSEDGLAFELGSMGDAKVFATVLGEGSCDAHFAVKLVKRP